MKTLNFSEAKISRNYDIKETTYARCDLCRRYWKKAFELIPEVRFHTFDSIVLCKECILRSEFKFLVDINEVVDVVNKE